MQIFDKILLSSFSSVMSFFSKANNYNCYVFKIIEVLCFSQLRKILIVNFFYDVMRNHENLLCDFMMS